MCSLIEIVKYQLGLSEEGILKLCPVCTAAYVTLSSIYDMQLAGRLM